VRGDVLAQEASHRLGGGQSERAGVVSACLRALPEAAMQFAASGRQQVIALERRVALDRID